jgi:hypothetical protein
MTRPPVICGCARPQIYEGGQCARCGHWLAEPPVSASTMQLAIAIAEVVLGYRKLGTGKGGGGSVAQGRRQSRREGIPVRAPARPLKRPN